jgi:tyrosinase
VRSSNQADGSGARMVTRRRVISRSLALGGAALVPTVFLTTRRAEAKPGTRYDVSTKEGKAALVKLENGIRLMKDETKFGKTHPFSYFYQAGFHGVRNNGDTNKDNIINALFANASAEEIASAKSVWNTCVNHYGTYEETTALRQWFLPWHRMYIYYFERIVRHVLGDKSFMLPYWNWSDPTKRALPPPFLVNTSSLYNVTRYSADDVLKFTANVASGERFDKFSKDNKRWQQEFGLPGCVAEADYFIFSEETIEHPHGAVHVRVGTDMLSVKAAAYDPIFWLHHANVDRLWTIWCNSSGPDKAKHANPDKPDWQAKEFSFFDVMDGRPRFVNAGTGAFVDTKALPSPYKYDDEKGRTIKATLTLAKARIPGLALAAGAPLPSGASLVANGLTMSGASPVRLAFTGQPTGVTLRSLAARCDDLHPLRLRLHNVEAAGQPGSTYPLLLDLVGADGGDDLHFAGEQVFFDNVVPPGPLARNFGRDSSYNISETVLALAAAGKLAEATTLTIVPRGDPTVRVSIAGATITLG